MKRVWPCVPVYDEGALQSVTFTEFHRLERTAPKYASTGYGVERLVKQLAPAPSDVRNATRSRRNDREPTTASRRPQKQQPPARRIVVYSDVTTGRATRAAARAAGRRRPAS